FIKRAQAMDFKLAQLQQLLELRDQPTGAREEARRLAHDKLMEVLERLRTLRHLRDELRLLLNLCASAEQCPILELKSARASGHDRPHSETPRTARAGKPQQHGRMLRRDA
ncbi:MAG: hypothetical protein EPN68_13805, partial [Rhodanobacter sp.]